MVMSTILKRTMYPKKGEEVAVYKSGKLVAEGLVVYADNEQVSIVGDKIRAAVFSAEELLKGIEDRSIVVKKKQ